MSALLAAEGLELAYGEASVCRDLAFEVHAGEIVTLLGANGAGKSTTLRAVAGALIPRAGTIRLRGQDITRLPSHARSHLGIALVPEGRHVFPYLTARENLELGAFKHRRDHAKVRGLLDKMFAMFPRLAERAGQNAGTLSGGEQQMLALGRALMMQPKLLILDEPTLGLAPVILGQLSKAIERLRGERSLTLLLAEQNVTFALPHSDRVYVLDHGRITWQGDPARFAQEMSTGYL